MQLAAGKATTGIDALDVHLEGLLLRVPEKRRGSGHGKEGADSDRLLRNRGSGGEGQGDPDNAHRGAGILDEFHGSLLLHRQ